MKTPLILNSITHPFTMVFDTLVYSSERVLNPRSEPHPVPLVILLVLEVISPCLTMSKNSYNQHFVNSYNGQFQVTVFSWFCYILSCNHEYIHCLNHRKAKEYITISCNETEGKLFERRHCMDVFKMIFLFSSQYVCHSLQT